jgi:tetratricopeptide (TPR) repeat protein
MLDWLYCSLCADPVEERRKIRETILVTAAAIDYPQNQKTNHDWVFEKQIYTTILWVYRLINRYYVDCENSMQLEVAAAICKICIVLSAHGEFEFYNPENLFLRLIGAYGKIYGRWCLQAMDVATHLGKHYIDRGENKKALILYEKSLEQYEKRCGKDGVISLRVADQIGVAYRNMGLYDKAFEYAKRAVEGYQKSLGKEDFETLMATNNMALAYMNLKRYDEALESNAIVVAGLKENFRNCPSVITRAIRDTATIHQKSGNLGKRIECLRNHMAESCEIAGYGMGPETFESAFAMAHACIPEKIDTPAALEQFRLSFEMVKDAAYFYEENRNWFHFEKLEVMDTLITGWIYQGEIEKAMENQILNLAYRQQCLVADHLSIAQGHQQLGYLYTLSKRYPLALEEYRKALILYSQNVGPEHIYVLRTRFDTAVCYSLRNDFEKAIEEYSAVLVTMERVLGKEHNLCLVTTKNLKEMVS